MKKSLVYFSVALLALFTITSCTKEVRDLDTSLTPVGRLSAPTDLSAIKLEPATGADLVFEWTAAQTADSGLILYELVFDKADGNFSNPIYRTVSDGSGVETRASLTQKDLNKVAALAGVESSSAGRVKWAVMASKGTNALLSAETRTLQVERPAGFAIVPATLYLYGTATEAGNDITKAIPLKKVEEGVYELYTSLQPGSYLLTEKPEAGAAQYFVDATGMIRAGTTAPALNEAKKVYRLRFDFNVATTSATEIQGLGLFMSAYNTEIGQLTYVGNSTWEAARIPVEFFQFSWGRDERYKFILRTATGNEYMGSQNANNVQPAGQPRSYFSLVPVSNNQWDNTYKFDPAADRKDVKVSVSFKADGPYTHTITVL
ncbi:SusE outer membrane protein [Cnuella takakiae]|uniref:SusE outer membrane protein n=1 Tax=Cnuella takakiae TaxID=1302690 RepID=A0A1M5CI21_9BACT|nr:SusE domain-containing protein [Cnuella takakiae]OLY91835.1 hypothetical protein BUE76_07920 [Cnuella takakiae]SHF54414.1 SusE outer membrane protein [Cnuella takakiae]